MNTPKVWIVKEQMRRTEIGTEPMDYSAASPYGEICFITRHDMPAYPKSSVAMQWYKDVKEFTQRYDASRDFIVATGQPTAIFNLGWLLGMAGKLPRYLIWRREDNRYQVVDLPADAVPSTI